MSSITEQYQKIYEQALEAQKKYNNNIKNKKTTTSSKKNNASKNKSNSNTQNKIASNQSNKNDSSSNPYNVSVAQPDYTKFIGKNKTSLYQNSTNSKNNPYQLKVAQPDYTKFKSQIDTIVEKGKKALSEREKAFNDWYTEDKKDMLFNADGSYRDLRSELNEFESKIKTEKADSAYSVYKNKQYKKELEKAIEFSDYLQVRDKEKTLSSAQEKIDFYTMQDAYNDNFLEKSAKKIGKVGANILNMPFQAADIVNDFLDPNFDINNPHNLSNQISSSVDKAEEQMQYNTNDFEQFALNTLESAVDFGTHYMLGMVTGIPSIVSMAAQSGLSKYAQNRREGYDEKTSLGNAILSGSLTMLTEKIGLDNFTKIASSGLGKFSVSALVSQALSEGAEEGIEYTAEPLIDYATLGKYPDYNAGELFMSVGLGMSGGALIGSAGNMISAVKTRKGANQLKADMQLLTDYANKNVLTNDEAFVVDQTLRLGKKALDKFESTSVIGNAVQFESDKVPQRSVEEIKQNFYSFLQPQVDAERASYKEKMAVANVIKNAQQTLLDKGIKMDVLQYSNLDEDVKKQVDTLQGLARDLKQEVVFDSELNVDGVTIDGYYDNETGRIVINPNGNNPAMSTFVHELTHGTESSKNYKLLKDLVKASDKDFDKNVQNTKELYKSVTDLTDDGASQEYVAIYLQEMLGNEEFVKRLVKYDTSLASRIYEGVKKVVFNTKTSQDIEYAFMKAFRDSGISEQALLQYSFKDAKGRSLSREQHEYFKNSKARDENGNLKVYYHGTSRADRVGTVFDPERATSGPMAYFTDNEQIASNYARDKHDTSIAYDERYKSYYTQFRIKHNGEDISVSEYWSKLPYSKRSEITEKAKHITMDDDWENVIYDENVDTGLGNMYQHLLREHNGNAIEALIDSWLEDGNIYGEEQKFLDVLKLAGINDAYYLDPNYRDEKVYETYLNVINPLETSELDINFADDLEYWINNNDMKPYQKESSGSDTWDKNNWNLNEWVDRLRDDIKNGTTHVWTSIPDAITAYLKEQGYDGISDTGGKNGGETHQVMIPFYSNQVKNVDNSTPTTSRDIRYSKGLSIKDIKNRSESKAQETFTKSFMDKKWMNPKYVDEDYFDYLISAEREIKNNGDVSEETKSKLKNATWKSFIVEEENAGSIEMINDQKDIRKFMKNGSLSIDSIGSINQITDFKEFRKKNFGNFTFTKNGGRDVDSVYQELVEQYPHYFDESITHPADQIEAIAEFLNTRHEETKALHLNQHGLTTKEFEDFFDYKFDNFVNTVKGIPTETKEEDPVLANFKSKYSDLNPILVDRAVDEVQKNGYVSETTKGALKDDLMKFFGDESIFKDNPKAKNRIQDFISETVEHFATKGQYESDIDFANSVASKVNKLIKGYAGITNEDIDNLYDEVAAIKEADSLLKEKRDLRMLNYTDLVDDMLFKGKDSKGYMSQIERVFDKVADGDVELRTKIRNTLELPRYQAQIQYVNSLKKYNSTIEQIVKTGIREGSKESKAVQWIMEKQREDGSKYTNADLYNEFNYKMKNGKMAYDNIENAAKLLRKDYDDMYQTIEGIRNSIYGDVELKNELDTKELHAKFEIARENLNKIQSAVQNNPTAQNQRVYAAALNEYKLLSRQLSTKLEDNASGDSTRRQDLKYRENYAHRTYEKESVFLKLIKERVGVKEVPTKLAGVSDYAQPKTGYASFFKKRVGGSYEADALKGFSEYIHEASRIIAYDPLIEYYRDFTSALQNTAKDDTMSQFTRYLINYTNSLAGKTNPIDRPIRELMGDTLFGAFKEINSRVKANAILGNIRTAVTQFANAPMAASMLVKNGGTKSLQDLTKGSFNYLTSLFNGKGDKSNLSPFIQARFFDTDTDAIGIGAKVDNMFNFLLTKGDEIVTKMLWNSAYEQALRKNVDSPIFYADDLTRRTVAGRGHGEVPVALQSQVLNFIIPFQVETSNTMNNFIDMAKDPKSWGALLVALLGDFFFNELFENLTGSRPLFDPIDVVRDAIKNEEDLGTTSGHMAGEILGAMPGGNLTPTVLGMDSYETKKYFGDNDPSRYGTGNIGLSAIKDIASSIVDGKPLDAASDVVANFVLPGGGKQAQRTIESLQVNGIIPQYVNGEWVFSPAYYKRNGDVGYETDPEAILDNSSNLGNFIKQVAFGKWAGNEAQEYLNGGSSSGISSKSQKIIDWFTSKDENVSEKDIMSMTEEIEEARDGFTSSNPKGELIEWIDSKNYSNAEKNMIFDTYYGDSKQVTNLNNFSNYYNLSDRLNYEVKKIVLTAIGKKSSNKIDTIKNSKALEVRKKLDEIGLYDKYIDYILENDLDLSSMGLNKKVAKMTNEEFENEYGSIFENINPSKTEKEYKNLEYEKAINSSKAKKSNTSKSSTISQANKLKNINNIIDKISISVSTNNDSKVDAILNKMKNNYSTIPTSNSELLKRYLKEHAYDAALFN